MNSLLDFITPKFKANPLFRRRQFDIARSPEWWVWLFSSFIWVLLILNEVLITSADSRSYGSLILCFPSGLTEHVLGNGILKSPDLWTILTDVISNGMLPWAVMVIAMMFPLLQRAIRHTGFSIQRKDRESGILAFLIGYSLVWIVIGVAYLSFVPITNYLLGSTSTSVCLVLAATLFIIAGYLSWLPSRKIIMMQCEQTRPIRIQGWNLYKDCLAYGMSIGKACARMCWIPMAALMLAHHSIWLMIYVSLVILIERYYVSHDSKFIGYSWFAIGAFLLLQLIIFKS
ncbi:MAG: DUF2182 domain-containing protein [Crocinitomicaceae bacterium]